MHRLPACLTICLFVFVSPTLPAQQADPGALTLDRIFSSGDFHPDPFGPARWIEEGSAYTTLEGSPAIQGSKDIVRYETKTGQRSVLVSAQSLVPTGGKTPLAIEGYEWSKDGNLLLIFTNSQRVWRQHTRGDYWAQNRKTGKLTKLGGAAKPSTLMFAKFAPDGTRVGYVRENNVYVENLADGRITSLTKDGARNIINGTFDWVYEEELFLRDGWRWSPDGQWVAYWQINTTGVKEFTLSNLTDALYPTLNIFAYPKVGETNPAARAGIVSAAGGSTRWLDVPGDPRNHYLASVDWAGNSSEIVLQQLNRPQNANRVMLADVQTGRVRTIMVERDGAWVDMDNSKFHWLEKGNAFAWLSERDGWRHIYSVSRNGDTIRRITSGAFDVVKLEKIDEAGGWLYFSASPENATQHYLYRVRVTGGALERITPKTHPGTHSYQIAPNSAWAIHTYSSFLSPARTDLVSLPAQEVQRTLAANERLHKNVQRVKRGPSEFFKVDIGSGVQLDGWTIKPVDFNPAKRYPLLMHVYGEPAAQTVLDRWGGDEYLWYLYLAQKGYVIASVDNRGTPAPRGRAWRKIIYRKLGELPSADQAAAVRVIARNPFIDAGRIGVWGWSGGGSMSLNAIFRYPDLYRLAMAVAPVPERRLYDTIYEERYMGLWPENAEDYKRASPITFAGQLKGNLLIVHGTGDDNVHYQGTEKLINALIAANKPFAMMAYPNRTHAIAEGPNDRRFLFELLTRYLQANLPAGP
jgi:dipeptidyl-peptidase-4